MCGDTVYFKSTFEMCRHERNPVTSQLGDNREMECNLYKYGVETRHIPSHQAVEFPTENDPERTELAFFAHTQNRISGHFWLKMTGNLLNVTSDPFPGSACTHHHSDRHFITKT